MKALRKLQATRQINDALHARNGPSSTTVLSLPLQSEVRVWREKDGWKGPYKIIANERGNITVDMIDGPTTFRSTTVRPYYCNSTPTPVAGTPNMEQDENSAPLNIPVDPQL